MISYGKQLITAEDIHAVTEVLQGDFLTQGPKVTEFEQALCAYTGAKYCVAVANGTAALHIAVAALALPVGSEGITSPITFAATSNAMAYCGVKPVFADIDPASYCQSITKTAEKISPATRLLTPVHFAGRPCEMADYAELAKRHGLRLIEDAAHAIGSRYSDGTMVGNCKYSDMTIFSFHPVKTITCGEGGAVTTNNEELYQRLLLFRSHGITKSPQLLEQTPGPWYYEMHELGFNYRLTDIQAALGLSQLRRIEDFRLRRLEIVKRYNQAFRNCCYGTIPGEKAQDNCCFHLYVLKIDFGGLGKTRAQVMKELSEAGVGTQVHYIPVHLQPYYRQHFGYAPGDYPAAEAFYEQALSLPLYPAMTDADIEQVIKSVNEVIYE